MILAIAYDQRFAIGIASMHGMLVDRRPRPGHDLLRHPLGRRADRLLPARRHPHPQQADRSRRRDRPGDDRPPPRRRGCSPSTRSHFILKNCLYAGAAGLAVGFIVLGILPFIEKAFRITTSMTLLELADASQPLLRRLAVEAPGTYNHSLQVATLAEAAAEAIGANSLLCRVGSYYHDIGKINKADYFIENQAGGENRHINLTPNVSLHHHHRPREGRRGAGQGIQPADAASCRSSSSTTARRWSSTSTTRPASSRSSTDPDGPAVADTQYRYPGPKPRSKEVGDRDARRRRRERHAARWTSRPPAASRRWSTTWR